MTTLRCLHRHLELSRRTSSQINSLKLRQLSVNRLLQLILRHTLSDLIQNMNALEIHVARIGHRVDNLHVLARSNNRSISSQVRILAVDLLNNLQLRIRLRRRLRHRSINRRRRVRRIRRSRHRHHSRRHRSARNRSTRLGRTRHRGGLIRRTRNRRSRLSRTRNGRTRNRHRRHRRMRHILMRTLRSIHHSSHRGRLTSLQVKRLNTLQCIINIRLQISIVLALDLIDDVDTLEIHIARIRHHIRNRHRRTSSHSHSRLRLIRILTIDQLRNRNLRIIHTTRIRRRRHRHLSPRHSRTRHSRTRLRRPRLSRARHSRARLGRARNRHRRHRRTRHIHVTTLGCLDRHREALRLTRLQINRIQLLQLSVNRLLELALRSTLSDLINNMDTLQRHIAGVGHRVGNRHVLTRSNHRSISSKVSILIIDLLDDLQARINRASRIRRRRHCHHRLGFSLNRLRWHGRPRNRRIRHRGVRTSRTRHGRIRLSRTRHRSHRGRDRRRHRRHRRTSHIHVTTSNTGYLNGERLLFTRRKAKRLRYLGLQCVVDGFLQTSRGRLFNICTLNRVNNVDVVQSNVARIGHRVGDLHCLAGGYNRSISGNVRITRSFIIRALNRLLDVDAAENDLITRLDSFITVAVFLRLQNRVDETAGASTLTVSVLALTDRLPRFRGDLIGSGDKQPHWNINRRVRTNHTTRKTELRNAVDVVLIRRGPQTITVLVILRLTTMSQAAVLHADNGEAFRRGRHITNREVLASNITIIRHTNRVRHLKRRTVIPLINIELNRRIMRNLRDIDARFRQFNTRRVNCRFAAHHRWIIRQNAGFTSRQARHTTLVTNLLLPLSLDTESHRRLILRRNHTTEELVIVSDLVALNLGTVDVTLHLIREDTLNVRHLVPVQRRRAFYIRYRFSVQLIMESHRCSGHVTCIPDGNGVLKFRDTLLGLEQLHRLFDSEIALGLSTRREVTEGQVQGIPKVCRTAIILTQ